MPDGTGAALALEGADNKEYKMGEIEGVWDAADLLRFKEDVLMMARGNRLPACASRREVKDMREVHDGGEKTNSFVCIYLYRGQPPFYEDGLNLSIGRYEQKGLLISHVNYSTEHGLYRQVSHLLDHQQWYLMEYWTSTIAEDVDTGDCDLQVLLQQLTIFRREKRQSMEGVRARMHEAVLLVTRMSNNERDWREKMYRQKRELASEDDPFNQPLRGTSRSIKL
ncbi:hypothetical protein PROFUN_11180 [Planoprotostelium fungivorum]|uniref:Uncharacterized protein n=1 Tax=Planoprotostelium fungivorum TaxID=1890364 RepID=A0A2P6NAP8_9EUKA|nr:hypothetical protein PROFUN_11180 [Planoprotostelium fungivorum]